MSKRAYWLIKSEPSVYPYEQLEKDGRTEWTGIRNFLARNNLRAMKIGDLCLYYHSNEGKEIVGVAKVLSEATEDSTAPGENWASVMVAPHARLKQPVSLATAKETKSLAAFPLVTHSRLSVASVTPADFKEVLRLAKTRLP